MDIMFRPMPEEPEWRALPKGCKPRASYNRAFGLLRQELRAVEATDIIIEAGFNTNNIRNDGWPYSSAKPSHSTVRLGFKKKGKTPLSFTSGGHGDWVQNVYLIAMTLERLRAIERYGCVQGDEQYRGFSALPPGGSAIAAAEWASPMHASIWLGEVAKMEPSRDLKLLYRAAAMAAHPDTGGSPELMSKVNRARDFIQQAGTP